MNGFDNEFQFVMALNNKKVGLLDPMLYDFIYTLYGDSINDDMIIKSWRNHYKQKTDVFIKINGVHKRISIKMGSRNSVHVEEISSFVKFLKDNNIPDNIIDKFLEYHYGDGTKDGSGKVRIDSKTYKENNEEDINLINKYFSNEELIGKVIDRSVVKGLVFNDRIDAIVCGVPNDFIWMTRDDIKKIIVSKKEEFCSAPHFGPLICQPMNRCLNFNKKYEYGRNYVQIKWYSLFDDIIENMYNSFLNSLN